MLVLSFDGILGVFEGEAGEGRNNVYFSVAKLLALVASKDGGIFRSSPKFQPIKAQDSINFRSFRRKSGLGPNIRHLRHDLISSISSSSPRVRDSHNR